MLIYLATPLSSPHAEVRRDRAERTIRLAGRLMQQGYHIFSPIAHNYVIAKAVGLDMGWAKWGEYDTKFLTACGQLWIGTLEGWRESVGVNHEIEIMQRQKKPIWLVDEYSLRLTLL